MYVCDDYFKKNEYLITFNGKNYNKLTGTKLIFKSKIRNIVLSFVKYSMPTILAFYECNKECLSLIDLNII